MFREIHKFTQDNDVFHRFAAARNILIVLPIGTVICQYIPYNIHVTQ